MNKASKIVTLVTALVLLMTPSSVSLAIDGSLSSSQIDILKTNCVSLKNTLNQLHASDAVLRVNMGQIYESMLTRLMLRFNKRLSNNNINNDEFQNITDNYQKSLEQFRSDYIAYEEQMSTTLHIDCQIKPESFYNSVISARVKRTQVHEDVLRIQDYTAQYQNAFERFDSDYQQLSSGDYN